MKSKIQGTNWKMGRQIFCKLKGAQELEAEREHGKEKRCNNIKKMSCMSYRDGLISKEIKKIQHIFPGDVKNWPKIRETNL